MDETQTEDFRREAMEHGLRTRRGMSEEARERLNEHLESCTDWSGVCQTCGARLSGTVKQISEHKHDG